VQATGVRFDDGDDHQLKIGSVLKIEDALRIRFESPIDVKAISQLIATAFDGKPYADGDESELVDELRASNALFVSLVATLENEVLGHIAFSPARAASGATGWYGLGPLAVLPKFQGRGVGASLLLQGLEVLRASGAAGCVVVGDPNYYLRFGFQLAPGNAPETEPAEYFMAQAFVGEMPNGPINFHEAFRHPI
jgi:predicted N-acetyltransferase YhbS